LIFIFKNNSIPETMSAGPDSSPSLGSKLKYNLASNNQNLNPWMQETGSNPDQSYVLG